MRRLGGVLLIVLGALGIAQLIFWIGLFTLLGMSWLDELGCGENRVTFSIYIAVAMVGGALAAAGLHLMKDASFHMRPLLAAEALLLLAIGWVLFLAPACPFPSR